MATRSSFSLTTTVGTVDLRYTRLPYDHAWTPHDVRTVTSESEQDITSLFDAIRQYAAKQQVSLLELLAEHVLDDLPISVGRFITEYLEERKPKIEPGEVEYRASFASGRSDISERIEEIIYGPDPSGDD